MKSLFYLTLFFAGLWSLLSCNEDRFVDPVQYTVVRGRILYTADQQPAQNALVTLLPNNRVVSTDASGSCRFESVLAGGYTLQAARAGYVTQVAAVTVTTSALPAITLLLTEDVSPGRPAIPIVRGRVLLSANQQPAENALVTLSPNNRVVITDASGSFRFDSVTTGSYTLQAAKAGYITQVAAVTVTATTLPLITLLLTEENKSPNSPPTVPTLIAPAINSTVQPTSLTLTWNATDPNRDSLTYDVFLFKPGATTPTSSYTGLTDDALVISGLDYNTTYLWQVIASDGTSRVNGPIWSFVTNAFPDYSYTFARLMNGQYQIFGSNATGSASQLTQNGSNWRPTFSPNRQQIAFISNANTDLHLFIMNVDGSAIRQVTTVPIAGLYQTDLSFSWSPDGSQLLYPSNNRLYAVRTDGTGLRTVAQAPTGRVFAGCDWTPQGDRIAARTTGTNVYDNEITTFQADGSDVRSVYTRRSSRVGNPVFSVTGRQLVFSADSTEFMNEQGRQLDARIYLLDLNSNGITDLSVDQTTGPSVSGRIDKTRGTNDLDPRFSPNGAQIIFTNVDNSGSGTRSVYTLDVNPTGPNNRKLLFTSAEMPYWRQP